MVASATSAPAPAGQSFDRVWSVAAVDGEPKLTFVGRESGALEKYETAKLDAANPLLRLTGHTGAITGIIAATGEEAHTVSSDGTMRSWNTAAEVEGKRDGKVVHLGAGARSVVASGEAYFVGLSNGNIVKVEGGKVTATLKGHVDAVTALTVGETSLFSASYDYTVRSWDLASGAPQHVYSGHSNQVKGVAVLNNAQLIAVGRDDTLIVWNIPTGEGAAGDAAAAAEGDAAADAADAAPPVSGATATAPTATPKVHPAGIVRLPSTPQAAAVVGSQLVFGCSDGSVRGVGTKALIKAVLDYHADLDQRLTTARRKIDQNTAVKVKNAKKLAKKAIREFKAKLVAEATGEPVAAPASPADDEAAAEEAAAEDAAATLGPEREAQLAAFTAKANAEADGHIERAQEERRRDQARLAPLRQQVFVQEKEKFLPSPYCFTFSGPRRDAALCVAAEGASAFIFGSGAHVIALPCRVGVQVV